MQNTKFHIAWGNPNYGPDEEGRYVTQCGIETRAIATANLDGPGVCKRCKAVVERKNRKALDIDKVAPKLDWLE